MGKRRYRTKVIEVLAAAVAAANTLDEGITPAAEALARNYAFLK
jgi:hypothetical protein